MQPSSNMEEFQRMLKASKRIIAIAGAGLSAASGIPTFRGAGGMWRKYNATDLATEDAFLNDPARVWEFYHYRREKARIAQPNPAHGALAAFSLPSIRHQVAPESSFTLITQNVDGLSRRAFERLTQSDLKLAEEARALTEQTMLEIHGRVFDVACTSRRCKHREANYDSPIVPALAGTEAIVEAGILEPHISYADLPRCSKCGELARPGVVWFGETPQYLKKIEKLVERADLCLVIGTSSTVYPAAAYAQDVQDHGGKVAVFNLERSSGDEEADFLFLGPCEETLPKALNLPPLLT